MGLWSGQGAGVFLVLRGRTSPGAEGPDQPTEGLPSGSRLPMSYLATKPGIPGSPKKSSSSPSPPLPCPPFPSSSLVSLASVFDTVTHTELSRSHSPLDTERQIDGCPQRELCVMSHGGSVRGRTHSWDCGPQTHQGLPSLYAPTASSICPSKYMSQFQTAFFTT